MLVKNYQYHLTIYESKLSWVLDKTVNIISNQNILKHREKAILETEPFNGKP
jgi:hypothetical protein